MTNHPQGERSEAHVVYQPWPRETINEAVTEFNAQMHDGAGAEEILAGLHGLDFLTCRSEIEKARAALAPPPKAEPLTEEQIKALLPGAVRLPQGWLEFARAIERAHDIGTGSVE